MARTSNTNICNNNTNNNAFEKRGLCAAFRYFLSIFTVDECKTRWRTIRDSYKRITKKTTGSAASVKSKYNRDNLKFLIAACRTDGNL